MLMSIEVFDQFVAAINGHDLGAIATLLAPTLAASVSCQANTTLPPSTVADPAPLTRNRAGPSIKRSAPESNRMPANPRRR